MADFENITWHTTREAALSKSGRLLQVESDPEGGWTWRCQRYRPHSTIYQSPVVGTSGTQEHAREMAMATAYALDMEQGVAPGGAS